MQMANNEDITSVDLTEDEDIQSTIVYSGISTVPINSAYLPVKSANSSLLQKITGTVSPPPLTRIPRSTPKDSLLIDPLPKLTKIRRKSCTSKKILQKSEAQLISSTLDKSAGSNSASINIDSDDEEVRVIQKEVESQNKKTVAVTSSVDPKGRLRHTEKLVAIKKNNRLYRIVIPQNVIATTKQGGGPVLINIPEVGPLLINIDPQDKNLVTQNTQLEPFSLNFDGIMNKVASESARQKSFTKKVSKPRKPTMNEPGLFSDPVFCGSSTKQKNSDFYSCTDKLGFSKTEIRQSRKCCSIIHSILKKNTYKLNKMINSYEELKVKSERKHQIKPVKIFSIVGDLLDNKVFANRLEEQFSKSFLAPVASEPSKSSQFEDSAITHTNDYNDLLVTRKVVILNQGEELQQCRNDQHDTYNEITTKARIRGRPRKKRYLSPQRLCETLDFKNLVKPCYVNMLREDYIDKMYSEKLDNFKPASSKKSKSPLIPKTQKLDSVIHLLMSKVIHTEQKLRAEMFYNKPVLVLNEFNFSTVKYPEEYSKSNIVVAVNEYRNFPRVFLRNFVFINAVADGYVKLIDSKILCSYLLGELRPENPQKD